MIVGLLLAAGGARRFGSQKLVAEIGGVPIVRRAAGALLAAADSVLVVTGSDSDRVRRALAQMPVRVVENANWETGMASSLVCGVRAMPTDAEAIIVTLGDQPGIDPTVIRTLRTRWRETGQPIVVARYSDGRGHPVLFDRSIFDELLTLSGDRGAKSLIERSVGRVAVVDVNGPAPRDVDTAEDLSQVLRES